MDKRSRARLKRLPHRGRYDEAALHEVLDAGFLAHMGFLVDHHPFVIPTLYGRQNNALFLHGSAASRMVRALAVGVPVCATVTLVDGLVLARSAFNHSMNYRSAVVFGTAHLLEGEDKLSGLKVISEHLVAGRWQDVRPPSRKELKATSVLRMTIEEASVKVRQGPVLDDEADYSLPYWAGVVPLKINWSKPIGDSRLKPETPLPAYLKSFVEISANDAERSEERNR
jgi:nitroimidazol reductase NimA-like FMN-containing flavoprotein (pyridoxamine 5'-phosphate oxidase superfamily)